MSKFNLDEYELVLADNIIHRNTPICCYDIEVDQEHDFFIYSDGRMILTHNCDGYHIASLLINFFHKWFPNVIKNGNLFILQTPLVSVDIGKTREYFYSIDEFSKSKYANKSSVRYLKGLGSCDLRDWEYIFNNLNLSRVTYDNFSDKMLLMAFGDNSNLRKKWLEKTFNN